MGSTNAYKQDLCFIILDNIGSIWKERGVVFLGCTKGKEERGSALIKKRNKHSPHWAAGLLNLMLVRCPDFSNSLPQLIAST